MNINAATDLSSLPAKDRILLTAHDLFYRDGIRATGIDKIIAEAKVTKVTFYRHFPSKHLLIMAFLEFRHQRWMNWFTDALSRHGAEPGAGLTPLLNAMAEWFNHPVYRGCAFINSVTELGGTEEEVLKLCSSHKQDMIKVIAQLLPDNDNRLALAHAAAMAVDGAIVRSQMEARNNGVKDTLDSLSLILSALNPSR